MSPKRPRLSEATKLRRLRSFARKAIAMLKNEHAAVHDGLKDPRHPRRCVAECEPYWSAIQQGEEALR